MVKAISKELVIIFEIRFKSFFLTVSFQRSEKINALQEQCQFYEMKCSQTMKHAEELPKIQQELENRKAALNAVSLFNECDAQLN